MLKQDSLRTLFPFSENNNQNNLVIRDLGIKEYSSCLNKMQSLTNQRDETSPDEIWFLEHPPVYTLGQNGKQEHIISSTLLPIIATDRGGQVTYHGPGQLIIYTLIDIQRKKWTIRQFVNLLEQTIINFLKEFDLMGISKPEAPGVYIDGKKICSIGLRVRRGCTYHGLALNVAMDLQPFDIINPCGISGLKMTQLSDWISDFNFTHIKEKIAEAFCQSFSQPFHPLQ